MTFTLDVCIDNIESAINAVNGGANRLEVCSSLKDDGLTPSNGLVILVNTYLKEKKLTDKVKIYAMIRPRGGDFCYSLKEIEQMTLEIQQFKGLVSGFVFGTLLPDGKLDFESCKKLLSFCFEYENTFHRAIDVCKNPELIIEDLIKLGFKRIITSGQSQKAVQGVNNIKKLLEISNNRIEIVPASGVNSDNIEFFIRKLNIKNFHCSGKELKKSLLQEKVIENYNYDYFVTNEKIIKEIISKIKASI